MQDQSQMFALMSRQTELMEMMLANQVTQTSYLKQIAANTAPKEVRPQSPEVFDYHDQDFEKPRKRLTADAVKNKIQSLTDLNPMLADRNAKLRNVCEIYDLVLSPGGRELCRNHSTFRAVVKSNYAELMHEPGFPKERFAAVEML